MKWEQTLAHLRVQCTLCADLAARLICLSLLPFEYIFRQTWHVNIKQVRNRQMQKRKQDAVSQPAVGNH